MNLLEAIIIAIIEGLTEYLPVSSTGHMILASSFMGIADDQFVKLYEVAIQFGAILAVVVLYPKRFFQNFNFYLLLLVAFIPTAILGLALDDFIDGLLANVYVVATSLVLGGIVLVFIDRMFAPTEKTFDTLPLPKIAGIGLFQALAMIPGVSRSAATIIGGQTMGLSRKSSAEFSFFLAVPTMAAATGLKLLKNYQAINTDTIMTLAIGNVVAFLVAVAAIKFFIGFVTKHGFKVFGYYRIALGLLVLGLALGGANLSVD